VQKKPTAPPQKNKISHTDEHINLLHLLDSKTTREVRNFMMYKNA
jgi:hypothetical protein